ncbi:hypothetical protein [Bacterioplanoides sp.]|uniref:hypothetical protein n=1 Tax=Bacterioplanoides sp. TaxID=2066072 RepID=UPI003B002102
MRWIFFALVFANLLLFAVFWQQQGRDSLPVEQTIQVADSNKQLQLVSELEAPLVPVVARPEDNEVRQARCYVAGPYNDELDARHLLARAQALALAGSINAVDISTDEPSEYWVHVPPRATRGEALKTLRELQQRNVDSYIITQGDLAEGVSLGLFRNQASAQGIKKKVERFEIPVDIRVITKSVREYWVEIDQVAQLNEKMRERIQAGDSGISWQQAACSE